MERKVARNIVAEFKKMNGPTLSLFEALAMTKIETDGYNMYSIQLGDVTFLAWVRQGNVTCKTISW